MKNTFNHKLVNMVKDFKDPWHRGKNNGVCEAFYQWWEYNLKDTGLTLQTFRHRLMRISESGFTQPLKTNGSDKH